MTSTKRIFITYAWVDNEEGDFDFIAQSLQRSGLTVEYDKVMLIPGRRLWEQIEQHIANAEIDAWAYLVTPDSLTNEHCREEYYLALNRALETRGGAFPLIGLLSNVDAQDVQPGLKIRLCVPLSDSQWIENVIAGVNGQAPRDGAEQALPYAVCWHHYTDGVHFLEVRPRLQTLINWRIGVPSAFKQSLKGFSDNPTGGYRAVSIRRQPFDAEIDNYRVVGAFGPIGPQLSAYLNMVEPYPDHVVVGTAEDHQFEILRLERARHVQHGE